jgi:hypothetical protein
MSPLYNDFGILLRDYNALPELRGASRVARAGEPNRANSNSLLESPGIAGLTPTSDPTLERTGAERGRPLGCGPPLPADHRSLSAAESAKVLMYLHDQRFVLFLS